MTNSLGFYLSKQQKITTPFFIVLLAGNAMLLTATGSVLRVTGAMILLLLPGLAWAESFALGKDRLVRSVVGLGLSYALIVIAGLLLHYIPGTTPLWMVLLVLNGLSLGGIVSPRFVNVGDDANSRLSTRPHLLLLAILLGGALLRFYGLGYSEFQGDETKPMIAAAESLEGNEDALFVNRKKGPGEILVPMMQWRLTGTINELIARIPFALAGVLAVVTIYVITDKLLNQKAGLMAAGLMALNGFMVGFSRIIQYQQIVIWMSLLALLSAWEWRRTKQARWGMLGTVFLGVGVLFHFDTLLVIPALAYLMLSKPRFVRANVKPLLAAAMIAVVIVALFVLPFATSPQATFTANYVGGRIGQSLINNNLFDFFHYTFFYNSLYYVVITGLLVLGFLVWALANTSAVKRFPAARYLAPVVIAPAVIYVSLFQNAFYLPGLDVDLAFLPFTLLLLGAFLSPSASVGHKTVIIWFAVAFLGYSFAVADPRTHFYTVSPAWVMIAALGAVWVWQKLATVHAFVPVVTGGFLVALFSGYLYIAFLRQDVEFRWEWPESQPALYWSPYTQRPRHHFGFVRQVGWKAIGGMYATGQLEGRFDTNSGSGLYRWYSRRALWGCTCCQPIKYYLAFGYKNIADNVAANHRLVSQITLPTNGREVAVYQLEPETESIEPLAVESLYRAFDDTATPAAFVWPRGELLSTKVNFADLYHLVGYEIILPRPHPGEELAVVLHWQRGKNYQPVNFNVFVQLMDANGHIWGRSDSPPVCGQQHTSAWPAGETVVDAHLIPIDPNTPPGEYVITAGMHLPAENFRLPIFDEAGQPSSESVTLRTVTIE